MMRSACWRGFAAATAVASSSSSSSSRTCSKQHSLQQRFIVIQRDRGYKKGDPSSNDAGRRQPCWPTQAAAIVKHIRIERRGVNMMCGLHIQLQRLLPRLMLHLLFCIVL
jgi:hypothetical protein